MKIGLVSLGCPKNLVDGEVMLGLASQAGHDITADASSADVIVVNTCAFIDRAKEESIDAILEMAQLKRDGAGKRLVVTGCLAERYRDELQKEIPEIDAVLGTGEVPGIVDAIGESSTSARGSEEFDEFKGQCACDAVPVDRRNSPFEPLDLLELLELLEPLEPSFVPRTRTTPPPRE